MNPNIDVIAFGFSPRGNDDFEATSNVSRSPILFVKDIGDAYRASGRTRPIADDVSIHCHPNFNTDAPSVGFSWPNAGCANLDRFKQAWWDAFHDTAQPVFEESAARSAADVHSYVRLFVDEAGYQAQIRPDKANLYSGAENVKLLDDATQGSYYSQLIAMVACDPNVALLNLFHLVDERLLPGWQSGLELVDGTPRGSYAMVKAAIAANRSCRGPVHHWQHTTRVRREPRRVDPVQTAAAEGRDVPPRRPRECRDESRTRDDLREDVSRRERRSRITAVAEARCRHLGHASPARYAGTSG